MFVFAVMWILPECCTVLLTKYGWPTSPYFIFNKQKSVRSLVAKNEIVEELPYEIYMLFIFLDLAIQITK